MAGILQKLENNEAILLMYLADELPAEDRAEVECMLATDASLRRSLEELRSLQEMIGGAITELDAAVPAGAHEEIAIARSLRDLRRRRLEAAAWPAPAAPAARRRKWPWWTYPAAAAAASLFILVGLWGVGVFESQPTLPVPSVASQEDVVAELQRSFGGDADDADHGTLGAMQNDNVDQPFLTL